MDDIVLRGMAKWPDVPAVYGWLTLNRRGEWLIKGEPISNPAISAFIGRNYERDDAGRWFFQNGPQRVFVSLDYTPLVYRALNGDDSPFHFEAHTAARPASLCGAWIDETGALLIETEHGIGLVHDRDLENLVPAFADANGGDLSEDALDELMDRVQRGDDAPLSLQYRDSEVKVEPLRSNDVPRRFGFDAQPVAPQGHPECA